MKRLLSVFVALVLLAVIATGVAAQSGGAGFYDFETSVRMWQNLRVLGTAAFVGDITASDDMTVTDDLVVSGDLDIAGAFDVPLLNVGAQTTVTVVFDGSIAPTTGLVRLTAAGNVGTSDVETSTAEIGDVVTLINESNTTITITDTAPLALSANAALTQNDALTIMYDGNQWVEIAKATN